MTGLSRAAAALAAFLVLRPPAIGQDDPAATAMRSGMQAFRAGRYAEAAADFRLARFASLEDPPRHLEALARLALAEDAAGQAAQRDATLERFRSTERSYKAFRLDSLDPDLREKFTALVVKRFGREKVLSNPSLAEALSLVTPRPVTRSPSPPEPTPTATAPIAPTPAAAAELAAPPAFDTPTVTRFTTPTLTPRPTQTLPPSRTPSVTATAIAAPSATRAPSPSSTPTLTDTPPPTASPSLTATREPSPTSTRTATATARLTHTASATATPAWSPSLTPTRTHTETRSPSSTPTASRTPIPPTATASRTATPSRTPTTIPPTATASRTETPVPLTSTPIPPTATVSRTETPIPPTVTPSLTATRVPTWTPLPTWTPYPTRTPIPPSPTPSRTATRSPTWTPIPPSVTPSRTSTPSRTATSSRTATPSRTPTRVPARPASAPTEVPWVRSTEVDTPPRPVVMMMPVYPEKALRERVRGLVVLSVLVSETGIPLDIEIIRGPRQDVNDAAVAAAKQWRFEPAQKDGRAVRTYTIVRFPFEGVQFARTPLPQFAVTPAR